MEPRGLHMRRVLKRPHFPFMLIHTTRTKPFTRPVPNPLPRKIFCIPDPAVSFPHDYAIGEAVNAVHGALQPATEACAVQGCR